MVVYNIKEINGCLKDEKPCEYLIGYDGRSPLVVHCGLGNQCVPFDCCYYKNRRVDNMLYDEVKMREICDHYNIEVIEGKGAPLFQGQELTKELVKSIFEDHIISERTV